METTMQLFIVLAVISFTLAVPEYHRIEVDYGNGNSTIQDVMFDEEGQYSIVALLHVTGEVKPSMNLHDFATGFSAMKDVSSGNCFIKESAHPMHETKTAIEQAINNGGHYEVEEHFSCQSQEAVSKSDLPRFGPRIAAFCANYQSVFGKTIHKKRNRRSVKASRWCFMCTGCDCDCSEDRGSDD